MNTQVSDYIAQAAPDQRQIMETIRQLIHSSVPEVSEEFKWSRPVFRTSKDFAYFKTAKAYVTLGFFSFEKIDDTENKLEGTGKEMRHIKVRSTNDIDPAMLENWIKAVAGTNA